MTVRCHRVIVLQIGCRFIPSEARLCARFRLSRVFMGPVKIAAAIEVNILSLVGLIQTVAVLFY